MAANRLPKRWSFFRIKSSTFRIQLCIALLWTITPSSAQTARERVSSEQSHFSAEDRKVKRPVRIPDSVLAIINEGTDFDAVLDRNGDKRQLRDWLLASEVHLDGRDEKDLVVIATGELRGANVTEFWVFRPTRDGFQLLLNGPAHDLIVKSSRSNGYRDIELWSATAVEVLTAKLRFDGKKYQTYKSKSEPIP